nr:MAG TPA: hypothetical protein [Caudoviricetes sp.]
MLIVALQDDVDNLYAIWDTVTDRFLGVNLGKYEAVGIIMDYKGDYTFEKALDRVEHQQPFMDIAKYLCDGFYDSRAKEWLLTEIKITNARKCMYSECFDGVPVDNETRIKLCESHIRFCEKVIEQLR